MQFFQILATKVAVILRPFDRHKHGTLTARNDSVHHVAPGTESGQTLSSVQHAQPPGRAAAAINQPPAALQGGVDYINGLGDLWQLRLNRKGDLFVS